MALERPPIAVENGIDEQLRQAQRMEAIGTLAGGLAHDFNNLLTTILCSAAVMKQREQPGSEKFADLDRIELAAKRASRLTRQLLGLARKEELRHDAVDLHGVVVEAISILKHTLDRKIHVEVRNRASRAVVMGDPAQLQQVILNLALNGADAMPEGGKLRFITRLEVVAPETAIEESRPYVVVEVRDDGVGVPAELQECIFEPFFTTKPRGKGTGMGLAVARSIVENHGGAISVASRPAEGTSFSIYLPLAATSAAVCAAKDETLVRGEGRLLVTESQPMVRETMGEILHLLGYEVWFARDSDEMVATYREHHETIDLVILDLGSGGASARGCLRGLLELNPAARVLLSSAGETEAAEALVAEGAWALLEKPYTSQQLGELVAAALE